MGLYDLIMHKYQQLLMFSLCISNETFEVVESSNRKTTTGRDETLDLLHIESLFMYFDVIFLKLRPLEHLKCVDNSALQQI